MFPETAAAGVERCPMPFDAVLPFTPLLMLTAAMASARPHQNRLLGILLRIGAASCFGCMGGAIKLGYDAGVSTPELVFYRFGFGLPPLLLWIASSRNFGAWRTHRPMAHVSRAMLGLTTM